MIDYKAISQVLLGACQQFHRNFSAKAALMEVNTWLGLEEV
jgi:hypothetical protein